LLLESPFLYQSCLASYRYSSVLSDSFSSRFISVDFILSCILWPHILFRFVFFLDSFSLYFLIAAFGRTSSLSCFSGFRPAIFFHGAPTAANFVLPALRNSFSRPSSGFRSPMSIHRSSLGFTALSYFPPARSAGKFFSKEILNKKFLLQILPLLFQKKPDKGGISVKIG